MATFTIKLEAEDIVTSKLGNNYIVQADGVNIIFTPEALKELISDYEKIKEASVKRIGVIARSIEDFRNFVSEFGESERPDINIVYNRNVNYFTDNKLFYRITKVTHLCGYSFDEILETGQAYENEEYGRIKEMSRHQLKVKR